MRIGVLKEVAPREHRVALTPEAVAKLIKAGATVVIERGAGDAAYCPDAAYVAVGAECVDSATARGADLVCAVQVPEPAAIADC